MGTASDVVKITVQANAESAEMRAAAAAIDNIKEIPGSYPDGKRRYEYRHPKGMKEIDEDQLKKFREEIRKRFKVGFENAVGDAALAMKEYKSQKTSLSDRAIGWVIETVGSVDDPGDALKSLQAQTNAAASAGISLAAGNDHFQEAAGKLVAATISSSIALKVLMAYKNEMVGGGESVVKGLETIKNTSKFILDLGSKLPGPAGKVAKAGSTGIDVAEAVAPLAWGDSDKINWEKLAEVGVKLALDKLKIKDKINALLVPRLMKTALGKKLGEKAVKDYVAKFVAEEIVSLLEATVKELSKNKDMKWKTFLEDHFYKRAQKRFESKLPDYIPSKVKEEIVKSTGKKITELMR